MGNGARAHNHFCVNVITIIHSSPTGTPSPVLSIHAYCESCRSVVYLTKSLKAFKGSFLSVVLSFRLYLVGLCTFYKERL